MLTGEARDTSRFASARNSTANPDNRPAGVPRQSTACFERFDATEAALMTSCQSSSDGGVSGTSVLLAGQVVYEKQEHLYVAGSGIAASAVIQ